MSNSGKLRHFFDTKRLPKKGISSRNFDEACPFRPPGRGTATAAARSGADCALPSPAPATRHERIHGARGGCSAARIRDARHWRSGHAQIQDEEVTRPAFSRAIVIASSASRNQAFSEGRVQNAQGCTESVSKARKLKQYRARCDKLIENYTKIGVSAAVVAYDTHQNAPNGEHSAC